MNLAKTKLKSRMVQKFLKIEESDIDVYYRFYLNEIAYTDLTKMQQEKLERYRKAWSWYSQGRTKEMIISALTKDYDIEARQAEYDYNTSIKIHGAKDIVDKDGRRVASMHYFDMLSQMALADKNFHAATIAREKADDAAGLNDTELEGINPLDFMKPSKIMFVAEFDNDSPQTVTFELDE